jgi:hypothetical protein
VTCVTGGYRLAEGLDVHLHVDHEVVGLFVGLFAGGLVLVEQRDEQHLGSGEHGVELDGELRLAALGALFAA